MDINHRPADVKAIIRLNNTRKTPAKTGYRPAHLIKENYLTSGVHHYIGRDSLFPCSSCEGTITFLAPEHYPHCLHTGQIIQIHEGANVVGTAEIIEIYNKLLEIPD